MNKAVMHAAFCLLLCLVITGCASKKTPVVEPSPPAAVQPGNDGGQAETLPEHTDIGQAGPENGEPGGFAALPGWQEADPARALEAFQRSCKKFAQNWQKALSWKTACEAAAQTVLERSPARVFFEHYFVPVEQADEDHKTGLLTAYYEPEIMVRKTPQDDFDEPVYARPPDLVTVEPRRFADSGLRGRKIMGRVENGQLVPYYDRAEILHRGGQALAWGRAADVFFLQVQGSGRLRFADGHIIGAAFAGHNGLPYTSIGRQLIRDGELRRGQAGKAAIDQWLRRAGHQRAAALMNQNRRYVFFKARPVQDDAIGPIGTQGVPLTPRVSLAVDPALVPLGSPIWVQTRLPAGTKDWKGKAAQFMAVAQDTGGAISGPMRGDLYWGTGEAAGREAGRIKHPARWWVLRPKTLRPDDPGPQS